MVEWSYDVGEYLLSVSIDVVDIWQKIKILCVLHQLI
jgi:hypothetical protein